MFQNHHCFPVCLYPLELNSPVVVVSSVYDSEIRQQFFDLGVQSFIIKSDFERGNLISIVKELLND